jgi:hypothetical protein
MARSALLAAPVVLALLPGAATAAAAPEPPTAQVRAYAEASYRVLGADRREYDVTVRAAEADLRTGDTSFVSVVVRRCAAACTDVVLDAAVAGGAVAVDQGDASASAVSQLGGPLRATWSASAPTTGPGLQVWASTRVRAGTQREAVATVSLFGARCAASGGVIGHALDVRPTAASTSRSAAVPAALRRGVRCVAEPSGGTMGR